MGATLTDIAWTTGLAQRTRAGHEADGNHNDLSYYIMQKKTPEDVLMLNEIQERASEAEMFDVLRLIYSFYE